jgi:hypothetical protein
MVAHLLVWRNPRRSASSCSDGVILGVFRSVNHDSPFNVSCASPSIRRKWRPADDSSKRAQSESSRHVLESKALLHVHNMDEQQDPHFVDGVTEPAAQQSPPAGASGSSASPSDLSGGWDSSGWHCRLFTISCVGNLDCWRRLSWTRSSGGRARFVAERVCIVVNSRMEAFDLDDQLLNMGRGASCVRGNNFHCSW